MSVRDLTEWPIPRGRKMPGTRMRTKYARDSAAVHYYYLCLSARGIYLQIISIHLVYTVGPL